MTVSRKIKTSHEYPPIPIRSMDWLAYFDGDEEGPQGWGPTEADAIADLLDSVTDAEPPLKKGDRVAGEQWGREVSGTVAAEVRPYGSISVLWDDLPAPTSHDAHSLHRANERGGTKE